MAAGPEYPKCVHNHELRRRAKTPPGNFDRPTAGPSPTLVRVNRLAVFRSKFTAATLATTSPSVSPDKACIHGRPPTSGTNAGRVRTIVCPSLANHSYASPVVPHLGHDRPPAVTITAAASIDDVAPLAPPARSGGPVATRQ